MRPKTSLFANITAYHDTFTETNPQLPSYGQHWRQKRDFSCAGLTE